MTTAVTGKLALASALALVICGSMIGVAAATNTVEIDSRIILRESFPAFHGKVKSHNSACLAPRRVKLFKEKRNGDKKLLGKTQTDSAGKWEVLVDPLKSGVYYAIVKKRTEGTAGTIFVCLRDKSKTAVVD